MSGLILVNIKLETLSRVGLGIVRGVRRLVEAAPVITLTGEGIAIGSVCLFVCLFVCLSYNYF